MSRAPQGPAADSVRAALERVFESPEYNWEAPRDPFGFLRDLWQSLLLWLDNLREAHPVAYAVLVVLLSAVLVAILIHFTYLLWRALKPRALPGAPRAASAPRRRDAAWYMEAARRLAAEGRCAEAMAHRFTALVLQLDAGKALKFHPSKTPAEYAVEARLERPAQRGLGELVAVLYQHLFGGVQCTPGDFSDFERRAGELATVSAAD